MNNSVPLLEARGLRRRFRQGSTELEILRGIDLVVHEGEALCIVGASGAGKSTLLHILGTLDRPTEGQLLLQGEDIFKYSDDQLASLRNHKMGFVFQFHHLLAEFTALENVAMPCRIAGLSAKESRGYATKVLVGLGLESRMNHFPGQMSGGEQQRVAIGRALMGRPRILFADEPTGNLDSANGQMIQDLLFELWESTKVTLIVVTHDRSFAQRFPRILTMQDGRWVK